MKKILSLLLVAFFVVGLAACGGGTDDIPDAIIDCLTNPEGEGCPPIDPVDTRTAEEILADLIEDTWDGELTHLDLMLDSMNFDESMEFSTEINLEVEVMEEGVAVTHHVNGMMIDNYQYLETGTLMHRLVTVNYDGETMFSEVIYEEVATGVIIYVNIENLKELLAEDSQEIIDAMDTVGATEDWLMFRFDDTLANLVEIEVMKDLLFDIFFLGNGDTFFYDLQDQLQLELGVQVLSAYGINIGNIVQNIVDADYDAAQLAIESIDYENLILDLDMVHLVPLIVNELENYQVELDAVGFQTDARIAFIELNGTEALLEDLTTAEISTLLDIIIDAEMDEEDVDFSDMYDAYLVGELDHFIVMLILNQPEYVYDLRMIEVFDFDAYKASMTENEFYDLLFTFERDFIGPELLDLYEREEHWLMEEGFDYWNYRDMIEYNDVRNFLWNLSLNTTQRDIFVNRFNYQPTNSPDDPIIIQELFDAYDAGEYEEYVFEFIRNSEDVSMGPRDIPGFDYDLFKTAMDTLDYDAFYLEEIDPELLADALYEGQAAFDLYLVDLALTAPETASILEAFTGTVLELEEYMMYVDDLNYALDNLNMFEEYATLEYFMDNDIITMEIDQTPDFEILTTVTFNGAETSQLFVDVMADAYTFLDGFTTFELPYVQYLNCPTGETCEDFEEYLDVIDGLSDLGTIEMEALYNPSNPTLVTVDVDFTNMVNAILAFDEEQDGSVTDFTVTFTLDENATVEIPEDTSSVNQIAEDFAQVSLNFMTYDFVRNAYDYYDENPLDFSIGDHTLDTYGEYMNVSLAFDASMSFITLGGTVSSPTISCTLYWADGTLVFDQPISLSYLDGILDAGLPTDVQYQSLLDGVNQDNFHMSKLIMIFLFNDVDSVQIGGEEEVN